MSLESVNPDGSARDRTDCLAGAVLALLPTPRAQDSYERSNRRTVARAMLGEAQMTLSRFVRGRSDREVMRMVEEGL